MWTPSLAQVVFILAAADPEQTLGGVRMVHCSPPQPLTAGDLLSCLGWHQLRSGGVRAILGNGRATVSAGCGRHFLRAHSLVQHELMLAPGFPNLSKILQESDLFLWFMEAAG